MLTDESVAVDLPGERSREFRDTIRAMNEAGWTVRWHLGWIVTARREGQSEEATGPTLDEALRQVAQLASADTPARWP